MSLTPRPLPLSPIDLQLTCTPDHRHIENEEDARQRIFEGLPPTADLTEDHAAPVDVLDEHEHAPGDGPDALAENGEVIPEESRAERAARAVRRNSPNRIARDVASDKTNQPKNKHSHAERLRPDTPYSALQTLLREGKVDADTSAEYKYDENHVWKQSLTGRMRGGLRGDEF